MTLYNRTATGCVYLGSSWCGHDFGTGSGQSLKMFEGSVLPESPLCDCYKYTHTHIYIYTYYIHISYYIHIIYLYLYLCLSICKHAHMYIHVYIYIYVYIHTNGIPRIWTGAAKSRVSHALQIKHQSTGSKAIKCYEAYALGKGLSWNHQPKLVTCERVCPEIVHHFSPFK